MAVAALCLLRPRPLRNVEQLQQSPALGSALAAGLYALPLYPEPLTEAASDRLCFLCVFSLTNPRIFMTNSKGWIFVAGVLALALSLYLWFSGDKQAGIFVGLWVPSLWILADLVEQTELSAQ